MSDLGLCDLCHVRIIHQSITQLSQTATNQVGLWPQTQVPLNFGGNCVDRWTRSKDADLPRAQVARGARTATASVGVQRSRVLAA